MNTLLEQLNESRKNDIELLVRVRNSQKYNWTQDEIRNALFIYAICLSHLETSVAIIKFIDFSNLLNNKSKNFYKSVLSRIPSFCRHYEYTRKCRYKFSNKKIIEMLHITDYEMKNFLKNIVDESMKEKQELEYLESELERIRIESEIDRSIKQNAINEELEILVNNFCDEELDEA